jgi:hypothetical protein
VRPHGPLTFHRPPRQVDLAPSGWEKDALKTEV